MSDEATKFLTGLAQAVSTMSLYKDGHPARERALDAAYDKLRRLQERDPTPSFTFLGHEIVFGDRPLKGLSRWDWGQRLAQVGIQRLELTGPVTRDDLDVFLGRYQRDPSDQRDLHSLWRGGAGPGPERERGAGAPNRDPGVQPG